MGALYKTDRDAPDILLWSVSGVGGPRTAVDLEPGNPEGTYDVSLKALLDTVRKIAPLVDAIGIACNTLHAMEPMVREQLGRPNNRDDDMFVSIVDATLAACQRQLAAQAKFSVTRR